ncbi:hypothetical protein [Streptomyces sp. enrichment culture]|uniref:hypothetical protein n=1 Tax=Streptomyces sp. enrichment culture TaxID=1795815 RepID=UPI003F545CB6
MKIFGREPVYVLAFISIVLKLSAAYGLDVSDVQQGAIMAVLSLIVAVITAFVLKTGAAAAAIVNLAQGVLALFLAFGLHLDAQLQALWMLAVEGAVALVLRKEVTAPIPQLHVEKSSPVKAGPAGS